MRDEPETRIKDSIAIKLSTDRPAMTENLQAQTRRRLFRALVVGIAVFLLGRLFYLQVLRAGYYRQLSEENRMRVIPEPALRGTIVDRCGVELADNRPIFVISAVPREIQRNTPVLQKLCAGLGITQDELQRRVSASIAMPYWPVALQRDVDFHSLCYFEEHIEQFPGVLFQVGSTRGYREAPWTGAVLGYTRELTARDIEQRKSAGLRPGAYTGAAGVEKQYDERLRGTEGYRYLEVSALGRVIGPMPGVPDAPPSAGDILMLTVDLDLQTVADSALATYGSGVAIAIEPSTGEVLCFVSRPGFSANLFSGVVPPDDWNRLLADSLRPLLNRGIKGLYPPGSVAKLWTAGAALETNAINEQSTFAPCYGGIQIGNRYFHCHKPQGHGRQSLLGAIAVSCDVYFYQVGMRLGVADWAEYTKGCGFGRPTGVDLPGEDPGLVPDIGYYDRRFGKGKWTKVLAANLAIGQGEFLVTPMQVAQFIAGLANRGQVMTPHFLRAFRGRRQKWQMTEPHASFELPFSPRTIELLREGTRAVVAEPGGTAHWLVDHRYVMAGKTGTAQNPHGKEHAWFVAYAPYSAPVISVAVLVENAGHGSVAAAPIARRIIEAYFEKYYPSFLNLPSSESTRVAPVASVSDP